jgi:peptide/histidine transporter 3/4
MALESSLDELVSIKRDNLRNCCRPIFKIEWLKHKGALLVLIWTFLCLPVYHYLTLRKLSRSPIKDKLNLQPDATTLSMGLLLPIGGWLADAFFGRYKVISCGMWIMWFGAMLNGVSLVISKVDEAYGTHGDPWVSLFSMLIMGIGLGAFQANIIQFGIDQLIDASSTEIKSVIAWYTMTIFTSGITTYYSSYCAPEYVAVLIIAVFLTLAVSSDFIVGHWLTKEQIIENSLPLILKTIHYTIKRKLNGHPTHSLEHQGFLSIFNIAKRVYNGPFTSEQVEDVKTFFRVLVVIVVFTIFSSGSTTINDISYQMAIHLHNWPIDDTTSGCYHVMSINYATFTYSAAVVLIYLVVIHPLFHRFIPRTSIAIKFLCSIFIFFAAVLLLLGLETSSYLLEKRLNRTTYGYAFQKESYIDVHWVILPNFLNGLSIFLYILSGIEFICAQAPFNMKGLVLGIACALFGLGALINASISEAFIDKDSIWKNSPLTSGILWYLIMEGFIVLVGFIVLMVIVKLYKRRTRINMSYEQTNWQEGDIQY